MKYRSNILLSRCISAVLLLLMVHGYTMAQTQQFPARPDTGKLSAYLIAPTEGVAEVPAGWTRTTAHSYGNCAIADEALSPSDANAQPLITRSYDLPKSDYVVSICVRGTGKARLVGSEAWTDIDVQPANKYQWVELGTAAGATQVAVEVAPVQGKQFYYGGVLAEGDVMPVIPVADVWKKIQQGGPVTVAIVGDSVSENLNGTRGGASSFEKGNPGLMKAWLEQASGKDVQYIAHREPSTWPEIASTRERIRNEDPAAWPELDKIPSATIDGKTYLDARQRLDDSKPVHLVNLSRGGADSTYTWRRMPETIFDNDYFFNAKAMAAKGLERFTVRYGLGYYKPDLVIINFGTNDINAVHPDWTFDDYLFYTRCAATNIQQRFGAAVILSTPHKWSQGLHLKHHWQPLLVDRLRDFCRKSGLALADVYMQYGIDEDSKIHPGDDGHKHIADAYIATITGQPQSPASKPSLTAADFKDNGDGTVTVAKLGLMMFAAPNELGEATSGEEAAKLVEKLNAESKAGHNDWRLATREEAQAIVDQSRRPAIVEGAPFKDLGGFYYLQAPKGELGIDLTIGVTHALGERGHAKTGHVLPVRDAK